MERLIDRLISQLDTLIPFLELSSPDVFELISKAHRDWLSLDGKKSLPESYEMYRQQINHAAFLLGYSYAEAFLTDLVRQIYRKHPQMIPEKKQLSSYEVLSVDTYDDVFGIMIDNAASSIFYQNVAHIADDFVKKFSLDWPKEERGQLITASRIRNCIVHNDAIVDSKLEKANSRYRKGDAICLDSSDVNTYGLAIRHLAENLYERVESGLLKG